MKPLLQWPGGKSAIAQEIIDMMPTDFDRYIEPFVGGGRDLAVINAKQGTHI